MKAHPHRRIQSIAGYGLLIHEIRVARADRGWEARIVTLPNIVWVEPGGTRALTFQAPSQEKAEEMAANFIEQDCAFRGHRLMEASSASDTLVGMAPARRCVGRFPLRFSAANPLEPGASRRARPATTSNISETGLFIATSELLSPGDRVRIDLRLPGLPERLEGVVVWVRAEGELGKDRGMGIRLLDPSLSYRAQIQALR